MEAVVFENKNHQVKPVWNFVSSLRASKKISLSFIGCNSTDPVLNHKLLKIIIQINIIIQIYAGVLNIFDTHQNFIA